MERKEEGGITTATSRKSEAYWSEEDLQFSISSIPFVQGYSSKMEGGNAKGKISSHVSVKGKISSHVSDKAPSSFSISSASSNLYFCIEEAYSSVNKYLATNNWKKDLKVLEFNAKETFFPFAHGKVRSRRIVGSSGMLLQCGGIWKYCY